MQFVQSVFINSSPEDIYAVYEKVSSWNDWDPETESSSLDGEFVVGTSGKVKPKGAPESKITLTEVTKNESFTIECGLPLSKIHFVHKLKSVDEGTEVINEVNFTGLLAPLFGRLIGKSINKTLPDSLNSLKSYIES